MTVLKTATGTERDSEYNGVYINKEIHCVYKFLIIMMEIKGLFIDYVHLHTEVVDSITIIKM
jgi:hypothetical protein